jgi:hypothetical protein
MGGIRGKSKKLIEKVLTSISLLLISRSLGVQTVKTFEKRCSGCGNELQVFRE